MTTKRSLPRFWMAMLLLVLTCAVVIGFLLLRLHSALLQYESATPGAALSAYLSAVEQGSFDEILADADFNPTPLCSEQDYLRMLQSRFGTINAPSFRKSADAVDDDWESYAVYDGETPAGVLRIAPAPEESGRSYRVRCDYELVEGYTITVPQHLEVYAGTRQLTPHNAEVGLVLIEGFDTLLLEEQPVQIRYQTGPTLTEQEISVRLSDGEASLSSTADPHVLEGREVLSAAEESAYAALIEEAARVYASYVTNDAEFSDLAGYLLPGTQFYASVRYLDRSWYAPHESNGFENIAVTEITAWSHDSFSGKICFDYKIYRGSKEHTYPTAYHMPFVRVDGEWKLVSILVR